MFYFQHLLDQGLTGIDQMTILTTIIGIAYAILLIGFLTGLYQAVMRGGDVQALGVTAIKYLVVAVILANWSPAFREINDSFNQVAQSISNSSGAGDMFLSWMNQIKQQFEANGALSILPLVTGSAAPVITVVIVIVAYLLYAVAVILFGFFYTLYGCVLYVLGPLVLALLPMAGIGQLARTYATNLMIWNAWVILYAILGALITAVQANQVDNLSSFMGFFSGGVDSTLLGLISIFYALALMLIPVIAHRMISGDIGPTAFSSMRAWTTALGFAVSGAAGVAGAVGSGGRPSGGGGGSDNGNRNDGGGGGGVGGSSFLSSSLPPPQPSLAGTIRSAIMSADKGGSPPPPPGGGGGGGGDQGQRSPDSISGGQQRGSDTFLGGFRPRGLAQSIAFHTGRAAASAVADSGRNRKGS